MKTKEIEVGQFYLLGSMNHSRVGSSSKYFKSLQGESVLVIEKLNNYGNKNTIRIQGIHLNQDTYEGVSFWCSPYDLKPHKESK